jgi:RNA polymerase sigma-70 factor (ECF subfamily)
MDAIEGQVFLERLKKNDEEAYSILVKTLQDRIYNLALRIVRNVEEAEEILQETFLSVFDKIDSFQGKSKLSTWIYAIASNAALSKIRKKSNVAVTFDEEGSLNLENVLLKNSRENFNIDKGDTLVMKELREKLDTAIDSLPEGYRELFLLKEIEKLHIKEIAQILNLNPGVVKTRLHRARLQLRAILSEYWSEEQK